ncbi:MAG: DUF389 domain-containing protein [Solirubrobacterales bacterium]|nr:DUF389 domain-containing protein [Solirubrobacterales bacterium]
MLHLRLSASHARAEVIGSSLGALEGVRRMSGTDAHAAEGRILSADVDPSSADNVIVALEEMGVTPHEYVLARVDVVAPVPAGRTQIGTAGTVAWVEILGEARANSRPLGRYLTLMSVAAVIAALGVIKSNSILIVGAMAVSPDLLPVCASCVGLVARKWRLARRSLLTLTIGLALVAIVSMLLAAGLQEVGLIGESFQVKHQAISGLVTADYTTVLVALFAGIAAMLAFETRASAAVGVAISVTTIPVSAYLGVAFGTGNPTEGFGALAVLAINVFLLLVSGCLTLAAQRWAAARSMARSG